MTDIQKLEPEWLEFSKFWQAQIEPDLMENFFLVEKSDSIKNLCWMCWLQSSKQNE
jgi:hypothetical protein